MAGLGLLANRAHTVEFRKITPSNFEIAPLNAELCAWEHVYNIARPRQTLSYLTPAEFLAQSYPLR